MPASGGSLSSERWVISAEGQHGFAARIGEAWRYRRILWFFAVRAVESLYRRTHLGALWLFIRTLVPLAITSFVFGGILEVPSHGLPYLLFFLGGQLPWNCFDGPLVRASRGLEANRELLTKLYVPRVILPVGAMAAGLVEPAIITGAFVAALAYYRVVDGQWYMHLDVRTLAAFAAVILVLAIAVGLSFFTSIWQARARDLRFILRYVVSFWMFLTPVVYPLAQVPAQLRWVMQLNPLTAPIETFRWAVFPGLQHSWGWLAYSATFAIALLIGGWWYFTRSEHATLDVL